MYLLPSPQLRMARGQLAGASTAGGSAEARARMLGDLVKGKEAALARLRGDNEALSSQLKQARGAPCSSICDYRSRHVLAWPWARSWDVQGRA